MISSPLSVPDSRILSSISLIKGPVCLSSIIAGTDLTIKPVPPNGSTMIPSNDRSPIIFSRSSASLNPSSSVSGTIRLWEGGLKDSDLFFNFS